MDLQFPMIPMTWLRSVGGDTRGVEETLEVKLTDNLPDIGKVLCGWGQALVRSKQWNRDSVGISGGVMAWVLYQPEDGSDVRSVECWIPFQTRWETPPRDHDGVILAQCYLQGVDARSLSARKLMVRVNVGVCAQAMVSEHGELPQAGELSRDIQVLKKEITAKLAREAGEKTVSLEDMITPPAGKVPKKLLYYTLHSQISDCKLMADRGVFRGVTLGHCLCRGEDGALFAWDFQQPFSQFAELDREYGPDAQLLVTPVSTGAEMELTQEGKLQVKHSLIGQYLVLEPQQLQVVADAYSPEKQVTLQTQEMSLPVVKEILESAFRAEGNLDMAGAQAMDCGFFLDAPQAGYFGDNATCELSGRFQVLSMGDSLSCETVPWQQTWELGAGEDGACSAWLMSQPEAVSTGMLSAELGARGIVMEQLQIPMVTGITLGEALARPADRPSLVLKQAGRESLWQIAKQMGTTVQAIENANGLTQEPEPGTWMLIPVP